MLYLSPRTMQTAGTEIVDVEWWKLTPALMSQQATTDREAYGYYDPKSSAKYLRGKGNSVLDN